MSGAARCDGCGKYGASPRTGDRPLAWLHVERQGVTYAEEGQEMDFCSSQCAADFFLKRAEAGR